MRLLFLSVLLFLGAFVVSVAAQEECSIENYCFNSNYYTAKVNRAQLRGDFLVVSLKLEIRGGTHLAMREDSGSYVEVLDQNGLFARIEGDDLPELFATRGQIDYRVRLEVGSEFSAPFDLTVRHEQGSIDIVDIPLPLEQN